MAFEGLTEKLSNAFKRLRGKGRLTEADVKEAMKEIRMALLEADVNYKVVKDFVAKVTERAVGSDVLESLTPAQMIVKIVNEELTALMGGESAKLTISPKPPTVVMLVGLNGAGKTTNGAKLAGFMKKQNASVPFWWPATPSVPPLSSSWRLWADSWVCPCSSRDWATRWRLPRPVLSTPEPTATTSCFWIPPAGSMWTTSSWLSSPA